MKSLEFSIQNNDEYLSFKDKYNLKDEDVIKGQYLSVYVLNDKLFLQIDEIGFRRGRTVLARQFLKENFDEVEISDDFQNRLDNLKMNYVDAYDLIRSEYNITILRKFVIDGEILTSNAKSLATSFINSNNSSYMMDIRLLDDLEKVTNVRLDKYDINNYLVGVITFYFIKNVEKETIDSKIKIMRKR